MKKVIVLHSLLAFSFYLDGSEPSSLDTSFNSSGASANLFIANTINEAQDVIAQPDGKIITAGYAGDNAIIVRYNNDGSLDTTFNSSGTKPGSISVNLGSQTAAYGVALQPIDNKIIVTGYVTINNINNAFIARYNRNGSLDTSFGSTNNTGGYIITVFRAQSQLFKVKLQSNGAIVVTGWATYNGYTNALVARYTSAGFLDTTFNTTGYVTTLIGGVFTKARALTIQADGKIIVTGQAQINNNQGLIVIRYNSNGSLDTSFNSAGSNPGSISPLQNYVESTGLGLCLQRDQKIIIVGTTNQTDPGFSNQSYTIVRLNTDGTIDETFNADQTPGYILSNAGLQAHGVVVQSNSQIVTCGFNYTSNYIVVVIRYDHNGTLDPTFNFAIEQATNTIAYAIAMQLDGKIIVGGTITVPYQP